MAGHNHYPNCNCGWCHRGWGLGAWPRSSPLSGPISPSPGSSRSVGTTTKWGDDGGCCWQTSCPKCGAAVFFVRHNGGSIWFDGLGPPWPKHICFVDDPIGAKLRSRLAEPEIKLNVLLVGVVVETIVTNPGCGGKVFIEYGDKQRFEENILASADLTELPGCLVIVTIDDRGHPRLHWGHEFLQRGLGRTVRE